MTDSDSRTTSVTVAVNGDTVHVPVHHSIAESCCLVLWLRAGGDLGVAELCSSWELVFMPGPVWMLLSCCCDAASESGTARIDSWACMISLTPTEANTSP